MRIRKLPDAHLQERICGLIRLGVFPTVAAEAAGVSQERFEQWLGRAARPEPPPALRDFAEEVRKASAEIRALAESGAFKEDKLSWLKNGPGHHTATRPGWANAVARTPRPARAAKNKADDNPLQAVVEFSSRLLEILEKYPEVMSVNDKVADEVVAMTRLTCRPKTEGATDAPQPTFCDYS